MLSLHVGFRSLLLPGGRPLGTMWTGQGALGLKAKQKREWRQRRHCQFMYSLFHLLCRVFI